MFLEPTTPLQELPVGLQELNLEQIAQQSRCTERRDDTPVSC
jgi:hypothetical protein